MLCVCWETFYIYWIVFILLFIITMKLIKKFNKLYPNGSVVVQRIMTEETGIEMFKATVTPDLEKPERYFSAYADMLREATGNALEVAQDKAIENALELLLTKCKEKIERQVLKGTEFGGTDNLIKLITLLLN